MKVGILTFHCAHNYGAVLQCYALQEYLKSIGHEVYVIDYRPHYLTSYYQKYKKDHWKDNSSGGYSVKSIIHELIRIPFRHARYIAFQNFIVSRLRLYPYSENNNYQEFDAVIIGSDQIWNPNITGNAFDPVYFGKGFSCKKIIYAASSKCKTLTSAESDFYSETLSNLDNISVRENTLQQLLQPLTKKIIYQTLDPTLLAGDVLLEKFVASKFYKKKFVVIYEISPHAEIYNIAKRYAIDYKCEIVELGAQLYHYRLSERDQTASPDGWVDYIKNAEFVFTTSFHGVAFSILLKKKFFYLKQNNTSDDRIESLLEQLKLKDRIIEKNIDISFETAIDYDAVHLLLNQLRENSQHFLCDAL